MVEPKPQGPLPIELPAGVARKVAKQHRRKRRRTASSPGQFLVELPSLVRVGIAQLADGAVVLGVGGLVALGEAAIFGDPTAPVPGDRLDGLAQWLHTNSTPALHGAIVMLAFGFGYATVAARGAGRTLGRALTGTVLVHRTGNPMGWLRVLVRATLALVSSLCFGAGFFWSIVDDRRRTLHDVVTGTVVVRRRLRPSASTAPSST